MQNVHGPRPGRCCSNTCIKMLGSLDVQAASGAFSCQDLNSTNATSPSVASGSLYMDDGVTQDVRLPQTARQCVRLVTFNRVCCHASNAHLDCAELCCADPWLGAGLKRCHCCGHLLQVQAASITLAQGELVA